jgi:protocatechuate 3,4-dioxygenase beta subunit
MKRDPRAAPDQARRDVVFLIGSFAAAGVFGCGSGGESGTNPVSASTPTPSAAPSASASSCVVRPQLTEGPYFVDEMLNRSDIRSDPAGGAVRPGLPLRLSFRVSRPSSGACTPLTGALVDVWHCDALGVYSDAQDMGFNTRGQKFLRGYQVSDASGLAQFTTIYPGWYSGRAVHIHFKIRNGAGSSPGFEFTSQVFFDEAITDLVHAQAPYNTKGRRNTTNAADGIYQGGGSQLLLPLVADGSGYGSTFDIALQL